MSADAAQGRAAAGAVRRLRDAMAEEVTDAFLSRHPDWVERYGDRAREKGIEDARFHADFLAAAVEIGDPEAFGRYARWAGSMLEARGIHRDFVAENIRQIGDWLAQRVGAGTGGGIRDAVEAGMAALGEPPGHEEGAEGDLSAARSVFTQSCLNGDRRAAMTVVREALRGGARTTDIYVDILQESQYEVGRLWQSNRISVAQEHIATAVTQHVITHMYPELERMDRRLGAAIVTGVEGELHQLGANMVADLLECDGWDVRFLGTNAPPDGVVQVVADHRPRVVGISAMILPNLPKVAALTARLRACAAGRPLSIVVGGGLFRASPDLWRQVGADGFAHDLRDAAATVRRLVGQEGSVGSSEL